MRRIGKAPEHHRVSGNALVSRPSARLRTPPQNYSTLVPESRTTFSHFSVSVRTKAPNSSGLTTIGEEPSSASRDLIFAEVSAAYHALVA